MSIQLFQQLHQQLQQGAVVMATVIRSAGSVPREVGAKMLIWANGETAGTIGGGAGEAKVIQAALATLKTGISQRVEIDLSGATNRTTQGVCGGYMQVWLLHWSGTAAISRVRDILAALADANSIHANPLSLPHLITPLVDCAEPTNPGLSQAVLPYVASGQDSGFESYCSDQPAILFEAARPNLMLPSLPSNQPIPVFIEPLRPAPLLLIVGAGHVGIALAQAAHFAGFRLAVQDERPEWALPERFPPDTHILPSAIAPALADVPLSTNSYVALVTRGYTYDVVALQSILGGHTQLPVRYLGMIGSRKRSQLVFKALRESGVAESVVQAIHAPIGLDIGALTPEEIAISIVAELIQVRRGKKGS